MLFNACLCVLTESLRESFRPDNWLLRS